MLSAVARQQEKPRVIVTTDGEIDDQSSMIRFLMYSSDYDVAGIVQVNGVQKDGHSKDKESMKNLLNEADWVGIGSKKHGEKDVVELKLWGIERI